MSVSFRLYEAHRRVQRVNQGLEDKLLKLVDVCETEKGSLTKDVASLSHKLADAKYTIKKLTEDNVRVFFFSIIEVIEDAILPVEPLKLICVFRNDTKAM